MSDLDLSKLSNEQLTALHAAGGDLTKLPDNMLQSFAVPTGEPQPTESPDLSDRPLLQPGEDPLRVGARGLQAAREAMYNTASMPGNAAAWLMKKAGLRDENAPSPQQGPTIFDKTPETPAEKGAAYLGGAAGDVASTVLPFSFAGRVGKTLQVGEKLASMEAPSVTRGVAQSIVAKPGAQTALTAGGNAAAPVIQSSDLPDYVKPYAQMAVPFALGGATHMGQRTVSAAPAATTQEAERRALLDYGQSIGGKNTAGKIMDSKRMQTLESVNSQLPLPYVGGSVARTEAANKNAFQAEALRKAGDTSGATAAPPSVTKEITAKLGDKFNFLTENNELKFDKQSGADLAKAKGAFSEQLESQMPKDVKAQLDELMTAPEGAIISGRAYQNIRSNLSAMLGGKGTKAVGDMIDALDGMAERSLPKDTMADFKEVRQQWRNLVALKKSVGSANNPETATGNIPTAAYMRNSAGNPDIEKLGRYGATFVGDKIPNSHTAPRTSFGHLGGGIGGLALAGYEGMAHAPVATLGLAGLSTVPFAFQAAMNNPATRAAMLARLRNPSTSLIGTPTFGALAGQQALNQGR